MKVNVIRYEQERTVLNTQLEFHHELFNDPSCVWIDFKVSDRKGLNDIFKELKMPEGVAERIQQPGKTFRLSTYGDLMLLDLHLAKPELNDPSTFITFIFIDTYLITISELGLDYFQYFQEKIDRLSDRQIPREMLVHYFLNQVIDDDLSYSRLIKAKVDSFTHSLSEGFQPDDLKVISNLREEIVLFAEVLEDQYLSVGLIPDVVDDDIKPESMESLRKFASHFEHIQNRLERSEDKLEYLFQQYRNSVQEETNGRINTLTIVQAIFVPLTFIAGIYGMNFSKMPELDWTNGYFYALGLMGFIALGELWIFWRSGWFR